MHLKLTQKERFKKQQKQLAIWLTIKPLTELLKFQKLHQRIFQIEILWERFIPPELRHIIIDDLRLKTENYWWSKIKGRKLFDDLRLI